MAEKKNVKKKSSGKPIWIFMLLLVILVIGLGVWRFVINKDNGNGENTVSEEQVVSGDYNSRLQEIEKEINSKEDEINKLNEEMLPLMEERTNLEQQLIDLNEENGE